MSQWAKILGGENEDRVDSVVATSAGVYVSGRYWASVGQTVDLAGIPMSGLEIEPHENRYLLKITEAGVGSWAKRPPFLINTIQSFVGDKLLIRGSSQQPFYFGDKVVYGGNTPFFAIVSPEENVLDYHAATGIGVLFGESSISDGAAAVALGSGTAATGDYSFSAGYNSYASAEGAAVFGVSNYASGMQSFVGGGTRGSALGTNSVVFGGYDNSASGANGGIVGGSNNSAIGNNSFVGGGMSNRASASNSAIIGGTSNNANGQNSFVAAGSRNAASGYNSFASGSNSQAQASYAFVIGINNVVQGHSTQWIAEDDLFVVGNGIGSGASNRNNAFVIHKNGTTRSSGLIESRLGVRVPPSGDIPMGAFTSGSNPADLGAGLRYDGE